MSGGFIGSGVGGGIQWDKNDPLNSGGGICKEWMVAICEDIQRAIKNEFGIEK